MSHPRLHWKASAPSPLPNSLTFAAQRTLPKLPVPTLTETLGRLRESLVPLARNSQEHEDAERKIDEFQHGMGNVLQERLELHSKETEHWLEEWWDEAGYLAYRDSVVVNVSYYYGFNAHPAHLPQGPAARAATLTRAAMVFRQLLKRGLLKPEATKEGPICMDSYRWMFDCCRVPEIPSDYSVSYAKAGSIGDEGHVVVFRRNRPWKIECFDKGRLLSAEELERQFQYIYDNTTNNYPGIGVMTASNRDIWTKDYHVLSNIPNNASIITAIHSAAFTVSLDASAPATSVEFSRALWHGHVTPEPHSTPAGLANRWCDKPVQFIVFDNARAGIMGEHSVMDGTPTARMCGDVLDMIADPAFDYSSAPSGSTPAQPLPMEWTVTPALESAIESASRGALALANSQTLSMLSTRYGKAAIKQFSASPDGWAQMVMQLAYARLLTKGGPHPRPGATYEAASTRKFLKGRTEAIRVISRESDRWVQVMDDHHCTKKQRMQAFREALARHGADARRCGAGMGIDRHLFGLKKSLKLSESVPALFSDPLVLRSSYWTLSTSAIFCKHFEVYGWGEVVPNGFGVAYVTGFEDRLIYTVTSRKEMPNEEFAAEIAKAAEDVYALHAEGRESSKL